MLRVPFGASDDLRWAILRITELLYLRRGTTHEVGLGTPARVTLYRRDDNVIVVQCGAGCMVADQIAEVVRGDGFAVGGLSEHGLRFSVDRV